MGFVKNNNNRIFPKMKNMISRYDGVFDKNGETYAVGYTGVGNVGYFDGASYLYIPSLDGTETVLSESGTSTTTISAGRIDFTIGTKFNLKLSNGSIYNIAEQFGNILYDTSGNNNHATITGADLNTFWGQTQYEINTLDGSGYSLYRHDTDSVTNKDILIPFVNGTNEEIVDVIANYTKIDEIRGRFKYDIELVESHCGTFDGNTYAVGGTESIHDGNIIHINCIVMPTGVGSTQLIIGKGNTTIRELLIFRNTDNCIYISFKDSDGNIFTATTLSAFNIDEWNDISVIISSGNISITINNITENFNIANNGISYFNTAEISIASASDGLYPFTGQISYAQLGSAIFKLSEGSGSVLHNSGIGSDAILTGATFPDFWNGTQDVIHSNYEDGFSDIKETIGSTGYIDTGILPVFGTKMEVVGRLKSIVANSGMFGRNQADVANTRFYCGINNGKISLGFGSQSYVGNGTIDADTDVHAFLIEDGRLYVDGNLSADSNSSTFSTAVTAFNLKSGYVTGISDANMQIYSIKIDDILIYGIDVGDVKSIKLPAQITNPTLDINNWILTNPSGKFHNNSETKYKYGVDHQKSHDTVPYSSLTGNGELDWEGLILINFIELTNEASTITEEVNGIRLYSPDGDLCYTENLKTYPVGTYNFYMEIVEATGSIKAGLWQDLQVFNSIGIKTWTSIIPSSDTGVILSRVGAGDNIVISKFYVWEANTIPPVSYDEIIAGSKRTADAYTSLTQNGELEWDGDKIKGMSIIKSGTSTVTEEINGTRLYAPDDDVVYIKKDYNIVNGKTYNYYIKIESVTNGRVRLYISGVDAQFLTSGIFQGNITATSDSTYFYIIRYLSTDAIISKFYIWEEGTMSPVGASDSYKNSTVNGLMFADVSTHNQKKNITIYKDKALSDKDGIPLTKYLNH